MRFVIAALAVILVCSCEPDSPEIGSDFFNDGALDFSYIDTTTLKLSTIQFDKLVTGNASRLLLGTHQDEKLGKITAAPYFQLTATETINLKNENVSYDYLSLVLSYDTYSYYDTIAPMTINVYRVAEEIELNEGQLYNIDKFKFDTAPVGSLEFNPRPHRDSIEIRLSDVMGMEIFNKAKAGGTDLNSTNFLKYLRGLAVIPDTSRSACIIGLTTIPKLKLYYTDKSVTPSAQKFSTFQVNSGSNLFHTNITCDRKSTALDVNLGPKERLSSNNTDDEAYIEAGAGLALRIDIPYLRDLKQVPNFYVTQAILEIYPIRKSSREGARLPNLLKAHKADKRNTIYQEIEDPAYLIEDQDLDRSTHYRLDVTAFVKEQMELQMFNENALLFTTSNDTYPVAADRVYIGAPKYEYKTNLRIYFATVNN